MQVGTLPTLQSTPRSGAPVDLKAAERLLEQNRPAEAAALLRNSSPTDAKAQALLGAALFRAEDYAGAAKAYGAAVAANPEDKASAAQLELSRANAETDIANDINVNPFHKDVVLGAPRPGTPLTEARAAFTKVAPTTLTGKARFMAAAAVNTGLKLIGHVAGAAIGGVVGWAARRFGQADQGEIWTTWSRKNMVQGLLMLSEMRRNMNENNLYNVYPEGELVGFADKNLEAPEWTKWARTADGSWNNPQDPKEGAAGTRFGRNIDPEKSKADMDNLMSPNPREISRVLMTRDEEMKKVPFLNLLAAAWIQFENHDWVSHGDNNTSEVYEVPLAADDPARQKLHMTHMFIPKGQVDPTRRPGDIEAPTHLNEVTHWWDGSQLYGSDQKTQDSLRTHEDGKMALTDKGLLPKDASGAEMTGFRRNWWVGLSLLHTLFTKEHNSICDMLKANHPDWDDQRLFQTARLINAAVMAKIHTVEWTPAVLPNPKLNSAMSANWYGAATKWLRDPDHRKTVADFDLKDEISGGLVGGKLEKHGVPESRTEEFTAVYRLHSLLPDEIELKKIGSDAIDKTLPLGATRQKKSAQITEEMNMGDLLYSFGKQEPGQLVLNNYPKTLQDLSVPGFAFMDLAATDILRDRERGVPRYNEFRRNFGLNPIKSFDDLTDDKAQVAKLREVYGDDIEKLDMLVGTLAEAHRPDYFGFGETLFQVFILNASRRLQDDRFFTTSYNAETYTPEGLKWIDDATMKGTLLRHNPELAATGLANIDNAFEPWDDGPLDPARHPLRQYKA